MERKRKGKKRIISGLLALAMSAAVFTAGPEDRGLRELLCVPAKVEAAKKLSLSAAKKIALANSEQIEAIEMSVEAKAAAKQSALKSLKEKERSMNTFRWSPLFSFKFPTKPSETQSFEFQFKPQQLQSELRKTQHKLVEKELEINEKISNLFVKITELNYTISFEEKRLKNLADTRQKLTAKVALGRATKEDVNKADKLKTTLESSLATAKSKLENSKKKLSTAMGVDVSTGYDFEDPYVSSAMSRKVLPYLCDYALERDHTYYEACEQEATDLIAVQVNYSLINSKFRKNIGLISGHVQQALNGMKLNKKQFKKDYDRFLNDIDEPWQGSYRILFIRFPKEWTKGSLDGIRYVEDDPYVLYQASLDYATAHKERLNTETDIRASVQDGYDNFIAAKKAYETSRKEIADLEKNLLKDEVRYVMGEMDKEEYETEKSEYESLQKEMNEALSSYSESAYNFDRVTCGGASKYFDHEGSAMSTADEADRNAKSLFVEGAKYTIRSVVADQEFLLNVVIPEDFADPDGKPINVTDFELWCDNVRIGNKTPASQALKHLTLTISEVEEVKIRLYDGNTVITDCVIDPTMSSGPLNILYGFETTEERVVLGTYTLDDVVDESRLKAEFSMAPAYGAVKYYRIRGKEDEFLYDEEYRDIDSAFEYLSMIWDDFVTLKIELYDEEKNLVSTGSFDSEKMQIYEAH